MKSSSTNQDIAKTFAATIPESSLNTKHWWRHRNLRRLNFLLFFPLVSVFTLGFDGSMMNGLQSVESWRTYFGEPKGATLGLFNAAYPIGGIIATPFIPAINDMAGRRAGLALGASICIVGAIVQATANTLPQFVVSRGIIGWGTALLGATGGPLITEIAHPAHRSTATALFQTSYALGSILSAWITFGTFRIDGSAAWRIPSALQAFPCVIQLCGLYFVPESPRWLVSKERSSEALAFLARYHAEGNPEDPLVQFEFREIQETLAYEKSLDRGSTLKNYLTLFSTPGNRHRAAILLWCAVMTQWSGNAFISYYLAPVLTQVGITTSLQQTLINATQQVLSWLSAVYFATLPAKLGRRKLFLGSGVFILSCLVAITAGSAEFAKDNQNSHAGYAVVAFLYLFSPAYNFGLNGNLGLYITEIVPFHLRMSGMAMFQFCQTCLSILSTYTVPIGLESLGWKFYIIFLPWVVIEFVVVYFLFPETKGPSLEDITLIFDKPAKDVDYEANAAATMETTADVKVDKVLHRG